MRYLTILALVLVAFSSCSKSEMESNDVSHGTLPSDKVIRMGMPQAINSENSINYTDNFALYIDTPNEEYKYNNILCSYADGEWISSEYLTDGSLATKCMYWENKDNDVLMVAYSPYQIGVTNPLALEDPDLYSPLNRDQKLKETFENSDLLWARSFVQPCFPRPNYIYYNNTTKMVDIEFNHFRAKLTFNITIESSYVNTVEKCPVTNVYIHQTTATTEVTEPYETYTKADNELAESYVKYEAIIDSREIVLDETLGITFSMGGKQYSWKSEPLHTQNVFRYEGGSNYTIDMTIGDGFVVLNNITVQNWTEEIDGGNLDTE